MMKMKAETINMEMKLPWLFALITAMVALFAVGNANATCYQTQADATAAGATTVRIYGSIYTGGMDALGAPLPVPGAGAITNATVMVQNMEDGGRFECYGAVTGNTYEAFVPVAEEYVVMFSAPGHDVTSREFRVAADATADMLQDAFIPPRDLVTGELPRGNALVYALHENYVNTEDDFPLDPAFPGVHFYVFDEDGNYEQDGIAGSQTPAEMPPLFGPDIQGLYFFTGLKTGEHNVMALPPGVSPATDPVTGNPVMNCQIDPVSSGWYWLTTEEGTQCWEIVLRPNDPGTVLGAYLAWYAFVPNLGQLAPPAPAAALAGGSAGGGSAVGPAPAPPVPTTSTISGTFWDADGTDPAEIIDVVEVPNICYYEHQGTIFVDFNTGYHPDYGQIGTTVPGAAPDPNAVEDCVWPNINMDRGYAILWDADGVSPHPIATTVADPVTGFYQFDNVPPGAYKVFAVDWPDDYIWEENQVLVQPGIDVPALDFFIPRFYARLNGHVVNDTTGATIDGAKVNLRTGDGGVWKTRTTAPGTSGVGGEPTRPGYFNFDELAEIEVTAYLDVDYHTLPNNLRGVIDTQTLCFDDTSTTPPTHICKNYDLSTRDIGWFTANYRTELHVEEIPATEGYIIGSVFNDHLTYDAGTGTWMSNGILDEKEDKLLSKVTVNLLDSTGAVVATTKTGFFTEDRAVAQGHVRPYTPKGFIGPLGEPGYNPGDIEVDEWGGIFKGDRYGQYEFRGVAPGTYTVQVVTPAGFSPSPVGTDMQTITVVGGQRNNVDFGVNTLVPLAGEIEGGIFDDVFIDNNHQSILYLEKQGLPHAPVGIYDHLGYKLGWGDMGHPSCYLPQPPADVGGRICPLTETLGQKPEIERRAAPGVHIYLANDPSLPGYSTDYVPLAVNYGFGQGQFKFEADWSLLPSAFVQLPGLGGGGVATPLPALPANAPVIAGGAPQAMLNTPADGEAFKNAVYNVTGGLNVTLTGGKKHSRKNVLNKNKKHRKLTKQNRKKLRDMQKGTLGQQCLRNRKKAKNNAVTDTGLLFSTPYVLNGTNFGVAQGHSTVSLSGQQLRISSWSDTQITVQIPATAIPGPMIIATTDGISNSIHIDAQVTAASATWQAYLAARTIYVDAAAMAATGDGSLASPFATITEAMNNLPVERPVYVMVAAGVYNENVRIAESDIKIIGAGPFESMIDGLVVDNLNPLGLAQDGVFAGTTGPTFFIGAGGMSGSVRNVEISGFTITGGTPGVNGPGGGIFADYGNRNIDINNNIMGGNGGEYGGAIWMHKSNHDVRIWSNLISENGNFGGYSGGISINDEPEYGPVEPDLDHVFDDHLNSTPPGTYEIFNNLLYRNYSPDYGGAMSLYEVKDHLKIYGNVIMENRSDDHGGGIFFEDSGPVDLYDNVFLRNFASDDGGAISFEDVGDDISTVKVYNNLISENIADDRSENTARGGAISFDDTLYAEVYNNTITGNIVAGTFDPTGGAIDSERHGHEYDATSTSPKPPYFSDVKIYNNVIWDNWRLKYDIVRGEDLDYTYGENYVWTIDNLHVDNPAINQLWETQNNSESYSYVQYNDINGVPYSSGVHSGRAYNIAKDPLFVDPANLDWHINGTASPAIGKANFAAAPVTDLDLIDRTPDCRADMGAFEHRTTPAQVLRIPSDLLGMIDIPIPGTTKLHP